MSEERNHRKTRQGVVISATADKTVVVQTKERKAHPVYGKMMTRTKKYHVHDEENTAGLGDTVTIMESRPISKLKRWRLLSIIEKAK
jgi:small subunit ribosomal protein S17